jgi:hypothetical protein
LKIITLEEHDALSAEILKNIDLLLIKMKKPLFLIKSGFRE